MNISIRTRNNIVFTVLSLGGLSLVIVGVALPELVPITIPIGAVLLSGAATMFQSAFVHERNKTPTQSVQESEEESDETQFHSALQSMSSSRELDLKESAHNVRPEQLVRQRSQLKKSGSVHNENGVIVENGNQYIFNLHITRKKTPEQSSPLKGQPENKSRLTFI